MKISLWVVGKTDQKYLEEGMAIFLKRIPHYCRFEYVEIPEAKGFKNPFEKKKLEALTIQKKLKPGDRLILLDEMGTHFSSIKFAEYLARQQQITNKKLIFLVGSAFGFDRSLYDIASDSLALSQLTFTHQMIRLFFLEQLYRAFTIINNEPYHNN
jgi:23S rRNA (pseudouridine1915-N3)-methyltransferase